MPILSLIVLLVFGGFYCLYASAVRKVAPNALGVEGLLLQYPSYGRMAGTAFLLVSLGILMYWEGMAAGIFIWSILMMTWGSLIVLLAPLGLIRIRSLIILFLLLISSEIYF